MFWEVTINITAGTVNGGGDVYQLLWDLWWVPYSMFTLHQSPYTTNLLFYPLGKINLASQTLMPLAGILTLPLQLVNLAFTYNTLFFLSFALGGLFMYMLANYFVKNKYAAFIAGLIFAFSPMHIAQAYSHLQWTSIEFIPLFILFFIRTIREKHRKYAIVAAVSFVLLTFVGDIEQAIIIIVFVILSLIVFALIDRKDLLNKHTYINFGLMAVIIMVLSSPFLIPLFSLVNRNTLNTTNQLSDVPHNMLYSDNLVSFFMPSYYNGIFNNIIAGQTQNLYGLNYSGRAYSANVTERVSYLGYSVILLSILGIYYAFKNRKVREVLLPIVVIAVFLLLALGPYIQIYTAVTRIPTLFFLYRNIPLFNLVREPGRFDVIITVFIALLSAMGIESLLAKEARHQRKMALVCVFAILILIEYNGTPLSQAFANSLVTSTYIPKAYYELGKVPGNFSVLILPALPNLLNGSAFYAGQSMYYQTAMNSKGIPAKPIVGGYTGRENNSQIQLLESIPLVVSASYLQSGQRFVYPYPISENYTNLTLLWLGSYHVGALSVIRSAYNQSQLLQLYSYLIRTFGSPVYQDQNATVFSVNNAVQRGAGRSLVAYIEGVWEPGYVFCYSFLNCNQTFATTWWGLNLRGITLLSPNYTRVNMSMLMYSYTPGAGPISVYLGQKLIRTINVTPVIRRYNIVFNVSAGLNNMTLFERNYTQSNQTTFLNYGIMNITFTKR